MSHSILETGVKLVRNVGYLNIGTGSLRELPARIALRRSSALAGGGSQNAIFLVDEFFRDKPGVLGRLGVEGHDHVEFILTKDEPKTDDIDLLTAKVLSLGFKRPAVIIGMGGGITLDTTKALANLLTNGGRAEQYQGWDLVKSPGIYKIGIPTVSGTGAEASRTCVMTNTKSGLKLGMNSDYTVYDQIILDPALTVTVPANQYFFTGMDAYIHCIESTAGSYRNAIGDAYSRETINLCRKVFLGDDMKSPLAREQLMVASYLGGCAIATSYVGVVHPFSAGLSVVLGTHHCVGNCIAMRAMEEFYPEAYAEFWNMAEKQDVEVPEGICRDLSDDQYRALIDATVIHQKPLTNALGADYRRLLTDEKIIELFKKM